MRAGNASPDREPESGACAVRAIGGQPKERLEDPLADFERDAWPVVAYAQVRMLGILVRLNANATSGRRVTNRVFDQVAQQALQVACVALHGCLIARSL
jgi:hypothetical protein